MSDSAQSGPVTRKRFLFAGVSGIVGILLFAFIFTIWQSHALDQWIKEGAENLRPLNVTLIEDGNIRTAPSEIDGVVISHNSKERLVDHLSRSEIRYGNLRNRAWVKVYLVTYRPEDRTRVSRVNLLNVLEKRNGEWVVTESRNLTIP